jgi:hypothetical protein
MGMPWIPRSETRRHHIYSVAIQDPAALDPLKGSLEPLGSSFSLPSTSLPSRI